MLTGSDQHTSVHTAGLSPDFPTENCFFGAWLFTLEFEMQMPSVMSMCIFMFKLLCDQSRQNYEHVIRGGTIIHILY